MSHSDQINELAKALSAAQGEMGTASKDSKNPYYNSKYADLASCWEAIRNQLAKYGLAVSQIPSVQQDAVVVETILMHSSGQWVGGELRMTPMRQSKESRDAKAQWVPATDPQSIGSAITYARRYALQAVVGIAPEDDDGNAASGLREPQGVVQTEGPPKQRKGPPASPKPATQVPEPKPTPTEVPTKAEAKLQLSEVVEQELRKARELKDRTAGLDRLRRLRERLVSKKANLEPSDFLKLSGEAARYCLELATEVEKPEDGLQAVCDVLKGLDATPDHFAPETIRALKALAGIVDSELRKVQHALVPAIPAGEPLRERF